MIEFSKSQFIIYKNNKINSFISNEFLKFNSILFSCFSVYLDYQRSFSYHPMNERSNRSTGPSGYSTQTSLVRTALGG